MDWDLAKWIAICGPWQITHTVQLFYIQDLYFVLSFVSPRAPGSSCLPTLSRKNMTSMLLRSYLTTPALALLIKKIFKAEEIDEIGSNTKSAFLILRQQIAGEVFIGCKVLDRLIFALAELFTCQYIVLTFFTHNIYQRSGTGRSGDVQMTFSK